MRRTASSILLALLFVNTFAIATNIKQVKSTYSEPPGVNALASRFSDEFNSTTLDPRWTWVNPLSDCTYSLTANQGYLRIFVPTGNPDHGLPNEPPGNPDHAPRIMQPINGDFIIQTRVLFNPQYDAQGAGILVRNDSYNYVGIGRCDNWANPNRIQYFYDIQGNHFEDHSTLYSGNVTYLQLQRTQDNFTFKYSADGVNWITLNSISLPLADSVNIGLCVYDQYQTHPIYADFDYFRISLISTEPVANFTYSPSTSILGKPVTFNASSSLSGWNGTQMMPITEYRWSFGDGNITSTSNPIMVHTFMSLGEHNVTLTVTDSEGFNSSFSTIITVSNPTFISILTSSSTSLIGFTVGINGTLSDLYGNGLENQTVVIYYTFLGVNSWFPIGSGITDSLGRYYVQWIPMATGYFTIKAVWVGNSTYNGTSSTTTLSSLPYNNQVIFSVESNSTVSELAFNSTDLSLSFAVSGPSGTRGYTRVTIAKSLVANATNIRVYLDGSHLGYSMTSTDESWLLTFNYTHSTHKVAVDLNATTVPEFASSIFLVLLLIILSAGIYLFKKKTESKRYETVS